jgi:protein gp37
MGAATRIGWTDHTFNPWWGCVRVSPACNHCYAEAFAKRTGNDVWGKKADRRFFGEKHWAEPLKWAAKAEQEGVRRRVFCASMADVFEDRRDLDEWRERLWSLVGRTPELDWQLLTKRPENVVALTPWRFGEWPVNVWLGCTVEDQKRAEERLPVLTTIPARIRFLSCEPLLGELRISGWLPALHWIIVGGESGPGARRLDPSAAQELIGTAGRYGVSVFMKQAGKALGKEWGCADGHGADWDAWPLWAKVREFPGELH